MRRSLLGLALTLTFLLAPAMARAGTVSVANSTLTFAAAPGEANQLNIEETTVPGVQFTINDGGAPLAAGTGCTKYSDQVICNGDGVTAMAVDLGDGNDAYSGDVTADVKVTIHGGGGNDTITSTGSVFGDDGNDVLESSGSGATLDGGPGDDVLHTDSHFTTVDTLLGGDGDDVLVGGAGDLLVGGPGQDAIETDGGRFTLDCQGRDDEDVQPYLNLTLRNCLPAPAFTIHAAHVAMKRFLTSGMPISVTCNHQCATQEELQPARGAGACPYHGGGEAMAVHPLPTHGGLIHVVDRTPTWIAKLGPGGASRKALARVRGCRAVVQVRAYSQDGLSALHTVAVVIGKR